MCEFVELSYVSGVWPGWDPKLIGSSQVRGLGFRVLLSYYVEGEGERRCKLPSFAGGRA